MRDYTENRDKKWRMKQENKRALKRKKANTLKPYKKKKYKSDWDLPSN